MGLPVVGLVGSRSIDRGLQSSAKKTVTDFTFPARSRTPNEISIPRQGATDYSGPTVGDCYASSVEDTHLLEFFFLLVASVCATLALANVPVCEFE
tara:strand:- start:15196 stop:15483 length:288 start_codon:yes stop_codon:yes gene_type:complete